jgi:hypothetical protein
MSELKNISSDRRDYRQQLLTSVSALAMIGLVCAAVEPAAADDDSNHPTVWIELGGQLERMHGGQTQFAPPFFDAVTKGGLESPLEAGRPPIYSNGAEAVISFTPNDSDWVFSGSVRYGRSGGHRFLHQQTKGLMTKNKLYTKYFTVTAPPRYAQTRTDNSQTHVIADFQAGKDVGLGLFGSTSVISFGLRFAQFSGKSDASVRARPDVHFVSKSKYNGEIKIFLPLYHEYYATAQRAANFRGLGPSISWKISSPLIGNLNDGEIALDWGANAAVLFGRQKARIHHHSTGNYHYRIGLSPVTATLTPVIGTSDRKHEAVVPNLGAFAGLSFRFAQAKVSVGYRGDFFFGAMDGGLDTHKSYNQEFYGPFATVSVGLGG